MSELEEVTMTLTSLVKRDHPRWTANKCRIEASRLAKKFLADKADAFWRRTKKADSPWDIFSKPIREF